MTPTPQPLSRRLCVAPMMERTDRHCRFLMRLLSRHTVLYTEMVTSAALVRGRAPHRLLAFHQSEHPVAFQVGGSDPAELRTAAHMIADHGYDEINLNVGCPSSRVTSGRFGACLMAEPDLVARCVDAMATAVDIPITVKTRIGVDHLDSPEYLAHFIDTVAKSGCRTFIVHARKAWLKGLSPKENREIPPLHYERVHDLKALFPKLEFILNGGILSLEDGVSHTHTSQRAPVDGIMVGRAAYDTPYILADADRLYYGATYGRPSRSAVFAAYLAYAGRQTGAGTPPHHVLRHAAGLFHACAGARQWRQAVMTAGKAGLGLTHLARLAEQLDVGAAAACA